MAIAFGAALGTTNAGGVTTRSLTSLSLSGSNIVIIVGARTETVSKTVSSMNWDDGSGGSAQAFTQLGTYKDAEGSNHRMSLWYLANPTMTNSRIIGTINASDVFGISAAYWTGVAQSSIFTTPSQGGPTSYSSQDQADTSDTNGSWHVGAAISGNAGLSFSAGTTRQAMPSTGYIVDSNATVANGVSNTFTWSGGSSEAWITAMMRPPSTVDYTITAALGTYTLTGIDALFHLALMMTAAVGSYTLTGINAILSKGYGFAANVGSFVLTGIDSNFTRLINMTASVGAFTLTGIDALFNYGRSMIASVGSFVLTFKNIRVPLILTGESKHTTTLTSQSKNAVTLVPEDKSNIG